MTACWNSWAAWPPRIHPPLRRLNPRVPRELETIIARAPSRAGLAVLDRHLARALELLGRALEERPEDAEGHAARGRAFLPRERSLEAERELSLAIERAPTNPSYYLHRAAAREALAERERARSLAEGRGSEDRGWGDAARSDSKQVLVLSPDDIDRKIARARLAFPEGDLAEARRAAREGLRADPNRWEFHFLLERSTSGEDALAAFQEADRRRPNHPTLASHLAQWLEEARRPEALALVTRSLARLPADPQRLGDRVRILGKLLRFEEALVEASRRVQAPPEAPYALYQRGQLLLLDRPGEGIADLERCVRRIPPGHEGDVRGTARGLAGVPRGAEEAIEDDFRAARRIDPERPEAPLASGLQASFRGESEAAAARFREGVALDPRARDLFGE